MSLLWFDGFKKKPNAPWSKYYKGIDMNFEVPTGSIYDYLEKKLTEYTESSIDYYGKKVKSGEILNMIDECAEGLYNLGIKKGDIVTICLPNTLEGVVSCFAINKLGAVVNFIHPASSENEIKDAVNEMDSKVLIVIDTNYLKVENIISQTKLKKVILVSIATYMPVLNKIVYNFHNKVTLKLAKTKKYLIWQDFVSTSDKIYLKGYKADTDSNDPAIILNSGGTTGLPKGVVLSNGNLLSFVEAATRGQEYLQPGDTCLALMPIFHGFGIVHSILFPLCRGMNVILRPKFDVKEYCKMVIKYKPQILMGVPTLFESLISEWKNKKVKLDFIKCVLVGGDTLKMSLRNQINEFLKENGANIEVCTGYGLSEAVCGVALGDPRNIKGEAIGYPLPGIYVGIFDKSDKELPYGEEGEICVCGPTVMLGYYNNEKETNIALHVHKDGNVWLHTGDLGMMDEEGFLTHTNRLKRMIISSGYNVYPNRIEKLLESHPAVMLCSVVGVPHKRKMEVPKAYVVLNDDHKRGELILLELKKLCHKNLPKYAWPTDIEIMDKLPTTKVGKVDFKKLQEKGIEDQKED